MRLSIGMLPLKSTADVILHPVKYKDSITYEPLAEEAVIALIAKYLTYDKVDSKTREFFDEMDDGYLFSESNFDEFDLDTIKSQLDSTNELILGKDIFLHPKKDNILKLANLLKLAGFEVHDGIDDTDFEEIDELDTFDGSIVYCCDGDDDVLLISNQFKIANKITSDEVIVQLRNTSLTKKIKIDDDLKGVFGIIYEAAVAYPFERVTITNK
ncbi:MAG: hypothetical protein GXO40_03115 [Epsilonproteobacteria bacterium]|nr:hypothetical protein [Campylobacterota bacterium]